MNYKTTLLASAAILFASQAMAQDLTNPFAVPGKGQIMSETSVAMNRATEKKAGSKSVEDERYASEVLEYGLTDQFSLNVGITNVFDAEGEYNNDHNFNYHVGAKYNTSVEDALFQVAVRYETSNPKDFEGHHKDDRWEKTLGFDLKAGLDLGNGITPYLAYSFDSDIDTSSRAIWQSVGAGIHKYTGTWALDGSVTYEWAKNDKDDEYKNETQWWLNAAADYYVKENVALGVYGSYLLDSNDSGDFHQSTTYELGLRVKVLF